MTDARDGAPIKPRAGAPHRELERLDQIAAQSRYAEGCSALSARYGFSVFERFLRGTTTLEIGAAEGIMTEFLSARPERLTVVEGSARFCDDLRRRFLHCDVRHALVEEYDTEDRFDNIILGHVLEHVEDPPYVLRRVGSWLAPGGRILAAVPNSRSLHRQAAVIMGLLSAEDELNELDRHHGHRRVYNPETFRGEFLAAGLRIEVFGGYWLKPLSNAQLQASWSGAMLRAFMELGERYPDVAAELYVIAGARTGDGMS